MDQSTDEEGTRNPPWKKQAKLAYWLLLAVACVMLLAHIVLEMPSQPSLSNALQHLGAAFLKEVGFALLVAFLLIVTIETYTRERHEHETEKLTQRINKNLFEAVFKNKIPDELYNTVKVQLLESKVVRRNFNAIYTIRRHRNSGELNGWVTVEVSHSYELENIGEAQISYLVENMIDITNEPSLQKYCRVDSIVVGENTFSEERLREVCKPSDDHFLRYDFWVKLEKGSKIKIQTRDRRIMRVDDSNVLCSRIPTININVVINTPDGDLTVEVDSLHRSPVEEQAAGGDGRYCTMWAAPYGFFPYQGLYFQWRPIRSTTTHEIEAQRLLN